MLFTLFALFTSFTFRKDVIPSSESDDLFLSAVKRLNEQLNEDGPRLRDNMAKKVIFEEINNFL